MKMVEKKNRCERCQVRKSTLMLGIMDSRMKSLGCWHICDECAGYLRQVINEEVGRNGETCP